jgi:hypothetical protein
MGPIGVFLTRKCKFGNFNGGICLIILIVVVLIVVVLIAVVFIAVVLITVLIVVVLIIVMGLAVSLPFTQHLA